MKKLFTLIILPIVTCELFAQESNISEVLVVTSKEEQKDAICYSNTYSIPKYIFLKSK